MPEYRLIGNGYVANSSGDGELNALFKNLKYLRQDAYNDFELVMKGSTSIETLREVKKITGGYFAEWMEANFDNGRGPIADLIRDIVLFLNGKVGHAQVVTSLAIQENKLQDASAMRYGQYTPSVRSGGHAPFLEADNKVFDYDLFRLMAGVGPGVVGRIFLLMGGTDYYGSN